MRSTSKTGDFGKARAAAETRGAKHVMMGMTPQGTATGTIVQEMSLSRASSLPAVRMAAAGRFGGKSLEGTIAAVSASDDRFYGRGSETLTSGAPLTVAATPTIERTGRRLCAKDLVAEIHSINTQIHRIMFQVERAVARLATTTS